MLADWSGLADAGRDAVMRERGVATLDVLREAATELGIRMIACEAGLRGEGLEGRALMAGADFVKQHGGLQRGLGDFHAVLEQDLFGGAAREMQGDARRVDLFADSGIAPAGDAAEEVQPAGGDAHLDLDALRQLNELRLGTVGILEVDATGVRAEIVRLGELDGLRNPGVAMRFDGAAVERTTPR